MNFLSHYYFDKQTENPYIILGTVLPDLIKNANKNWNAHPQKHEELFQDNIAHQAILKGWKRHLAVDIVFHSSPFFFEKTKEIKQLLIPMLENSPVRPSFLAHISLELLLDHLLILTQQIKIDSFYDQLDQVYDKEIQSFLLKCGIEDFEPFLKFFNSFKSSRYLLSYQKLDNVSYALHRICMRLWEHPFDESSTHQLTSVLELYKTQLTNDFMTIFEEVENRLS